MRKNLLLPSIHNLKCESMEPDDIRIDRKSIWGNPFIIGKDGNREEVINKHYWLWKNRINAESIELLRPLVGKKLFCHCSPLPCHGDNYIRLIGEYLVDGAGPAPAA